MQLTEEQLAVLNHVVLDGQGWVNHHGNEEWMLAKVAKYKQDYLDAKASLGADYKTRQEIDDAVKQDEQDKYDNASYDVKRKREYPSTDDQLDKIYHDGIDAWKADMIKPVKDKYPKE